MENPTFHLESIVKSKDEMQDFSGPLNLILMLLSKNKIEIRDLRISEILDQYLEYIDKMHEMDLDVASEFVQMASHLVYIKTRTLLVSEEKVTELEELMSSLEQLKCRDAYIAIKTVVPDILKLSEQGIMMFTKQPEPLKKIGSKEYTYSHDPVELLEALYNVFSKNGDSTQKQDILVPKRIVYNVSNKSEELVALLKTCKKKSLKDLYRMSKSRSEVVATFISVLELCSMGNILIKEVNSEICVFFNSKVHVKLPEHDLYSEKQSENVKDEQS